MTTATLKPAPPVAAENAYLRRWQRVPLQITTPPSPTLGLVVVIPCYNEPDLLATLDSLWRCQRPACSGEIIIVINASTADSPAVQWQNRQTYRQVLAWLTDHQDPRLAFHVLWFADLDARSAGVGLARKLGMDEAVARFHAVARPDGIIVSLDADCLCEPTYLRSIEAHFKANPRASGGTLYFEHPLEDNVDARLNDGMVQYELFLRYYIHGLRFSGFPYAYYTLGSCMAVRSRVYEKQGGMNRRQGGEDFYFLHKIIPHGDFLEIRDTKVMPSARASERAPFGTGKAQGRWLTSERGDYLVYAPAVFQDLRELFMHLDSLYTQDPKDSAWLSGMPVVLREYLMTQGFWERLSEMQNHVASVATFRKRFFQWFNAFRVLKFIHWATANNYPKEPVQTAATQLLAWRGLLKGNAGADYDSKTLLLHFRRMDREGRLIVLTGNVF